MTDFDFTTPEGRLAFAQQELANREAFKAVLAPLVAAHEASAEALDRAKLACDEGCSTYLLPEDALEQNVVVAQASVNHEAHRASLEKAYAEFARTGHALGSVRQAPSNPAPPGTTDITAGVGVVSTATVN